MMRSVFSCFLATAIAIASVPAQARGPGMSPDAVLEVVRKINFNGLPRAFQNMRALQLNRGQISEALGKLAQSRPAEMSAHLGQTLLFLLTVTGVELVMTELRRRGDGKPADATLLEMSQIAATHLLNSGGTYLSILSAGVADLGLKYPAEALSAWLADPKARPVLYHSLTRSILATGSLLAWDLGSSLWMEATLLLETPAEFERSKSLFGMMGGSILSLFQASPENAFDRELLKTMAVNLVRVSLLEQDLRSKWIDNAFRTKIMSGEFAILSAALTAAGVGTLYLPGGGTVAGFILGVGAIVIAINIPEEIKDGITGRLHSVRMGLQRQRLRTAEIELREPARRAGLLSPDRSDLRVAELLTWRRSLRSGYLTIALERIRMVFKGMFRSKGTPTPASQGRAQIQAIVADIQRFMQDQGEITESLIQLAERHPNRKVKELLEGELNRIFMVTTFLVQVGVEVSDLGERDQVDFKTLDSRTQEFIKYVELSYARGFDEDPVVGEG